MQNQYKFDVRTNVVQIEIRSQSKLDPKWFKDGPKNVQKHYQQFDAPIVSKIVRI